MELKERFTLLTVSGGLRECALFVHLGHDELHQLRSVAIDHALFPVVSKSISLRQRSYAGYSDKISRIFRQRDAEQDQAVLWICSNETVRRQVKAAPADSWALLDYPSCCVENERRSMAVVSEAFRKGILEKAGGDPKLVRRALRENWKVEVDVPEGFGTLVSGRNQERTRTTFPFALHIACEACLSNPDSPTAELNRRYAAFARQIDPALYETLLAETIRS